MTRELEAALKWARTELQNPRRTASYVSIPRDWFRELVAAAIRSQADYSKIGEYAAPRAGEAKEPRIHHSGLCNIPNCDLCEQPARAQAEGGTVPREPTQAMMKAAVDIVEDYSEGQPITFSEDDAHTVWRAMYDAAPRAMNEKP